MESALILETTYLIDLERERRRKGRGSAWVFLSQHGSSKLFITPVIAGELSAGESLSDRHAWESFISPFHMLNTTPEVAWQYGTAFRYLKENGLLIGTNDLWIAAFGLANDMAVVTRNVPHFRRVPGLRVLGY